MAQIENPPAFPQGNEWMDHEGNLRMIHEGGMTLRDWFAGQALAHTFVSSLKAEFAAVKAYEIADAMLSARSGDK